MEPLIIQIDWIYALGIIGTLTMLAWKAGSRFSSIETSIIWIKETVTKIETKLTAVESKVNITEVRIGSLEGRFDKSFSTQSPISLLQRGKDILENSGLKKYIDENKETLLDQCKSKRVLSNLYDIQESSFKFFDEIELPHDLGEQMKTTAFNFGASLDVVRRIGGIYFRDICLEGLGFKPEDLDKPKTY
jgi:hypothetical protein